MRLCARIESDMKEITGGPLDMRILGLGKTRISGKSHNQNQKVVISDNCSCIYKIKSQECLVK